MKIEKAEIGSSKAARYNRAEAGYNKYYVSCFLVICIVLAGCCKYKQDIVLVQNNDLLVYVNYHESAACCVPFLHYPVISDFSLDAAEQKNKMPVTGKDSALIVKIIDDFEDRYHEDDEDYYVIDYSTAKRDLFFCGAIPTAGSVNSFLFLLETPDMYNDILGTVSRELYLLNCKNNQLASIVTLSSHISGIDRGITINSYLMNNLYFSQINYSFLDTYMPLNDYVPKQEIDKHAKVKDNARLLIFSLFIIDENGFVKLINFL